MEMKMTRMTGLTGVTGLTGLTVMLLMSCGVARGVILTTTNTVPEGLPVYMGPVWRSNDWPVVSWTNMADSACVFWNSNGVMYGLCTNSLAGTVSTNLLFDQLGTGGSQTPWVGDIDGNAHDLTGAGTVAAVVFHATDSGSVSKFEGGIWADGDEIYGLSNLGDLSAGDATVSTLAVGPGGGTLMQYVLSGTGVLDFPDTSAGTSSDLTVALTGAAVGDCVWLGVPNGSVVANGMFSAWVSATDVVTVRFLAGSGGGDPASGTFRVGVVGF